MCDVSVSSVVALVHTGEGQELSATFSGLHEVAGGTVSSSWRKL